MKPPEIDSRDLRELLKQMKRLAPYYTPEWRVSLGDPDPGSALMHIVADMLKKTIDRLNQVPLKHFIAFLNMLDIQLLQAHPASTYLRFQLVEGAREAVLVNAGTKVAAQPDGESEPVIFETEHPLFVTPAALTSVYQVSTVHDVIRRSDAFPVSLFPPEDEHNVQSHALYIGHAELLNLRHTACIELLLEHAHKRFTEAETCRKLTDAKHVEWQYLSKSGWKSFSAVEGTGNRIRLYKANTDELEVDQIAGEEGRWIRCVVRPQLKYDEYLAPGKLELTSIHMQTSYYDADGSGGIPPDRMFFDDIELDPQQFLPFGEYFAPYGTFYLASQEAFSKKRSRITLKFRLKSEPRRLLPDEEKTIEWKMIMKKSRFDRKDPAEVSILRVLWEYWDGQGWVRLTSDPASERIFYRPTVAGEEHEITFNCPDDMEETFVNSQYNYWIRARIISIENLYAVDPLYLTPIMDRVRLAYHYERDAHFPPERCMSHNNLEFKTLLPPFAHAGEPFAPFYSFDITLPACYFGFESPPLGGPLSMYVSIRTQGESYARRPVIEWQYFGHRGGQPSWKSLTVHDGTSHLTASGTVRFAGPKDLAQKTMFGRSLYWIRAVNLNKVWDDRGESARAPVLEAIDMNYVRAIQQETVVEEFPELSEQGLQRTYTIAKAPVIDEEVWVDETGRLSEEDVRELERAGTPLEVIRDSDQNLQRVWVRWSPVDHFYHSAPDDRHYTIERTTGKIRFGDGVLGRTLPNLGTDKVKVNYKFVAGKAGNVPAGTITSLQNSIAFIQSVTNPEAAVGGCDMETLEEAMVRGPHVLKHRNRAVTENDFEYWARQAYPNIGKVKCLAHYNARMQREPGAITLAVRTKHGAESPLHFSELQREVRQYLMERASCTIANAGQIEVVAAASVEVGVNARLVVGNIEDVIVAELEAQQLLQRFLDPYAGNFDGNGWEIGETVHRSMLYGLLKSIRAVQYVEQVTLTIHVVEGGKRRELSETEIERIPHGVVMSGEHRIVAAVTVTP